MKTLIGYHLHTPENTGVRAKQKPAMFFGQPVYIPPARRTPRPLPIVAPPIALAPSTRSQHVAFIIVAYVIAIGVALSSWL